MNTSRPLLGQIPPRPPSNALIRAVAAQALAVSGGNRLGGAREIADKSWPRDSQVGEVLRAAVTPTDSVSAAALGSTVVGSFVGSLSGQSAAAGLIARGTSLSLGRASKMSLPYGTSAAAAWVAEGAPIPVIQPGLDSVELGPLSKLAIIAAITEQLRDYSAESAEAVVGLLLREAAAKALDLAMFDDAPADDTRPAGLLNGIVGLTGTAGGGQAAAIADVSALLAALTAGGAAGADPILVAAPSTAARLRGLLPGLAAQPVLLSPLLDDGLMIAVDAAAFVSSIGQPEISASLETAVVFEDTAPPPISTVGSPAVVGAPSRSFFQQASIGIKLVLRASWALRPPGAVAWIDSVSW